MSNWLMTSDEKAVRVDDRDATDTEPVQGGGDVGQRRIRPDHDRFR